MTEPTGSHTTGLVYATAREPAFCVKPDLLLDWLTEISRHRALADHETDVIEAIVCRGHQSTGKNFRWNARLDLALTRAAITRGGIKRFADKHGITQHAAHMRLNRIRKARA